MNYIMKFDPAYIFLPGILILSIFLSIIFINFSSNVQDTKKIEEMKKIEIPLNLTLEKVIEINNVTFCKYLKDKTKIQLCKLKLTNCKNGEDECFYKKAIFERKEEDCFKINNDDLKATCSASIKISKIYENSVLQNNISLCAELNELENKQLCQDNFYLSKRYNNNNLTYCDKIKTENLKTQCLE